MAQLTVPQAAQQVTVRYEKFKGVDFSTDPALISDSRSPLCKNLVCDAGGFPEKRLGWRTLLQQQGAVHGLYAHTAADGAKRYLAHIGTHLYAYSGPFTGEAQAVYEGLNDADSEGYAYKGKLYLLDGAHYLVYDGSTLAPVEGYVPTTLAGATPDGAGTVVEQINLLTPWRTNCFAGDGQSKTFVLDAQNLDDAQVQVRLSGEVQQSGYTVDAEAGTVTFLEAPADGGGVDNVQITFQKTIEGNRARIERCRFGAWFGCGNDSRLFVAGDPQHPNVDYQSGLYDPTYFPDRGYTEIGVDTSPIMGYLRFGESLLIVKGPGGQDAAVYARTAELSDEGEAYFPLAQGVEGVGAVARRSFAHLRDDPLYLSPEGVFAVTAGSDGVKAQRALQNRSHFVDAKLLQEENPQDAVCAVWRGLYLLCLNGRCYVADARQKAQTRSAETYGYEWFYWENIPARVFLEDEGELFFGTADGRVCRFNTDVKSSARFNDDGQAVCAVWATRMDDDGDFMRRKTMPRRGSGVLIKPYARSGVEVLLRTEADFGTTARRADMSAFDFNDVNFEALTFRTNDTPQVVPFNKKVRRYQMIQLIAKNERKSEGFGIYGFVRRYTIGPYRR